MEEDDTKIEEWPERLYHLWEEFFDLGREELIWRRSLPVKFAVAKLIFNHELIFMETEVYFLAKVCKISQNGNNQSLFLLELLRLLWNIEKSRNIFERKQGLSLQNTMIALLHNLTNYSKFRLQYHSSVSPS